MSEASRLSKPIALTCGDPAGIGPDITLKSWLSRDELGIPAFAYLGDIEHLRRRAIDIGASVLCEEIADMSDADAMFPKALPVLPVPLPSPVSAGRPDQSASGSIKASIEQSVALTLDGQASAVVTNPIAKHIMAAGGLPYTAHTEFLGHIARQLGHEASPVMMLAAPDLRVVPVTIHIPLRDVPLELTAEKIIETAEVTVAGLQRWFGIAEPRLAVTGLNPHAGESGMIGDEEDRIIKPAIAALLEAGFKVTGPHPADALFHQRARKNYDAAIAMYHDQALVPLKTLAFDEGVNVTLGLPFIRTSPDHGTAFDIAGTGKARPDSLIAALRLAAAMANADSRARSE